jgi:hypothetical protein
MKRNIFQGWKLICLHGQFARNGLHRFSAVQPNAGQCTVLKLSLAQGQAAVESR